MFDKLIQAIHDDNADVINDYVRDNHDVLTQTDSDKLSPLHHACMLGKSEITRILLGEGGLVPNCQTVNGTTPLHFAARNGWKECVQLLIEFKATLNISDAHKWTPLHYACFAGHPEVVEMLVTNKANINMTTDEGYTPLHLCCYKGYVKIAEFLISHGANVSLTDKQGNTPLCLLPIESASAVESKAAPSPAPSQQKSSERRATEGAEKSPRKRKSSEKSAAGGSQPALKRVKEEEEEEEEDARRSEWENDPNRAECFSLIISECNPADVSKKMNATNKVLSGKWNWFLSNENCEICLDIINKMRRRRELYPETFERPVTEDIAPNYFKFIKRPMDFMTLEDYLRKKKIFTLKEFVICGRQIWQNCFTYNVRNKIFDLGKEFALMFENYIARAAWGKVEATTDDINEVKYSWNGFLGDMSIKTLWEIANKSGLSDENELDIDKHLDKIRKGFFLVNTRDLKEK